MLNVRRSILIAFILFICTVLFANPFNENLSDTDLEAINSGNVLIKNIGYQKHMCLKNAYSEMSDLLIREIKDLDPKYLAEVIQIKSVNENENLPERLLSLLNNVSDYAGIPYYSERAEQYYDLYTSAEIVEKKEYNNRTDIKACLNMEPFGIVLEDMCIYKNDNAILYTAVNTNKLRYLDKFDCVWPNKMKLCILLLKENDKWILYGIGGVNAPRIPFFTERIQTSFINRINTFCSFIFEKL